MNILKIIGTIVVWGVGLFLAGTMFILGMIGIFFFMLTFGIFLWNGAEWFSQFIPAIDDFAKYLFSLI